MHEKYMNILTRNRPVLVELMDPEGGLLNHLESKVVFTKRLVVTIARLQDPYKKNEAILDALYRRPDTDFVKFCEALHESGQSHVVETYLMSDVSSSSSSSSSTPDAENVELKKLGIDVRENSSKTLLVESMEQCVICIKNPTDGNNGNYVRDKENNQNGVFKPSDQGVICAETTEERRPPLDSPHLIDTDNIIVKPCETSFYSSKRDEAYEMNRRCRGKCLIINIYETVHQEPRMGAEVDEKILKKLFEELHFDIILYKNLFAKDILLILDEILSDSDLSRDQCFVLFVMSHGSIEVCDGIRTEVIFGSDGRAIATSQILEPISNCKALAGKPKLAFFQACRGDQYDESDCISKKPFAKDEEEDDNNMTKTDAIPPGSVNLKDFIVGFPTQSGFRSFRNTKNGSWYLNAIVRVFMEDAHHLDVSAMLRKVNGIVSQWMPRTNDVAMQFKGQVASIRDNLTKPYLYLFPGIIIANEIS